MQWPGDLAGLVRGQRGLLEGPDTRHCRIEAGEAAQVVARIAHMGVSPEDARLAREGLACLNTRQETSTRRNVVGPQAIYANVGIGALDAGSVSLLIFDSVTTISP